MKSPHDDQLVRKCEETNMDSQGFKYQQFRDWCARQVGQTLLLHSGVKKKSWVSLQALFPIQHRSRGSPGSCFTTQPSPSWMWSQPTVQPQGFLPGSSSGEDLVTALLCITFCYNAIHWEQRTRQLLKVYGFHEFLRNRWGRFLKPSHRARV